MNIRKQSEATRHTNAASCTAYEYEFDNKDINMAIIELTGRYPDEGYAVNTRSTSVIYVLSGEGTIDTRQQSSRIEKGDQVLILKNDQYTFAGTMTIAFAASPAWTPDQASIVK